MTQKFIQNFNVTTYNREDTQLDLLMRSLANFRRDGLDKIAENLEDYIQRREFYLKHHGGVHVRIAEDGIYLPDDVMKSTGLVINMTIGTEVGGSSQNTSGN